MGNGREKPGFVIDVLEDVEQEDNVKSLRKVRVFLANVVTIDRAATAEILLEREVVQVKPGDLLAVGFLDLELEKSVAAANFSDFRGISDGVTREGAEDIEAPLDPKVVRRGNFEPSVRHADFSRGG